MKFIVILKFAVDETYNKWRHDLDVINLQMGKLIVVNLLLGKLSFTVIYSLMRLNFLENSLLKNDAIFKKFWRCQSIFQNHTQKKQQTELLEKR